MVIQWPKRWPCAGREAVLGQEEEAKEPALRTVEAVGAVGVWGCG